MALVIKHWTPLQAEAQQSAITATVAPHIKKQKYRDLWRSLDAQARLLRPRKIAQPMPKEAIDPEAAAEWFAAQGVRVVKSS